MNIVAFRADHLKQLQLQDAQQYFNAEFGNPDYGMQLQASRYAFTGMAGDQVIGCAGVHELWTGRAVAWALLSKDAGPHFAAIHKAASGFFKGCPFRRVEAMVEDGFDAGHRWVRLLGFKNETPDGMPGYSPTGTKFYLYSRVKHG